MRLIEETDRRYEKAMSEASPMDDTTPLKLALALNYSSFKYEIEQNFEQAVVIANSAFSDALQLFQSLDGLAQFETMKVMVLLEDNLAVFKKAEESQ